MTAHHGAAVVPDPRQVVGLLADPGRLRVYAALVLAPPDGPVPDPAGLAATAGVPLRETNRALARFEQAALAARDGLGWRATPENLRATTDSFGGRRDDAALESTAPDPASLPVLRGFFARGRLTHLPSQRSKRLVVLDYVAQSFEPGVQYPEAKVNGMLIKFHDDFAMLRRCLVDEAFLARAEGTYWRIGGTVGG
jgi:hypothetical protein